MADEQYVDQPQNRLSKEQKIGFALLLVFGVITITLGFLQIRNTMYAPFALNATVPTSIKDEINTVDTLRVRDTDKDGLSDFDELYVYHTSPYLYDTFGYGFSDKDVIAKNLPLCAGAGKFCTDAVAGATTTNAGSVIVGNLSQDPLLQNPPADIATLLKDPVKLRQMLLENGMDANVLKKVSDSDLIIMAQQLLTASSSLSNQLNAVTNNR